MIGKTLELIRKEVNEYIVQKIEGATDSRIALTSFVNDSGGVAIPEDKVGLSLLNIEEEKHFKMAGLVQTVKSERNSTFINPPVNMNLQIMFTANFNNYMESLKHISAILSCFQSKPVFDTGNTPDMDTLETKKLIFELNTLGLEQQHYIWSMIGLRYLPSVIHKVKMLSFQERDDVQMEVPNIQVIGTDLRRKEVND
ncbi:MAG: DUF4255 domain-containing protein [Deltaproteobacteria bacterium]|nr:DUF4255 domain-containing protein [Deltaproteobacteria bacterium]